MNLAFTDLGPEDRELLERALEVRARAYAPYSNFSVGAAVRTRNAAIFCGCNVENSSYGLSVCAEVSSLTAAVAAGDPWVQTVAIVGGPRDAVGGLITPCGRCRQWIAEFSETSRVDIRVVAADPTLTEASLIHISALLPGAFSLSQPAPPETRR